MADLDQLRTTLANERTLLAYIRTALSLMIFGMVIIKFFSEEAVMVLLGWIFLGCGIVLLIWGSFHFRKISGMISKQ